MRVRMKRIWFHIRQVPGRIRARAKRIWQYAKQEARTDWAFYTAPYARDVGARDRRLGRIAVVTAAVLTAIMVFAVLAVIFT